jgi:hypothetical protein
MANSEYKPSSTQAQFTPLATLHDALDYLDRTLVLGEANFPRTDSLKVGMAVLVDDEWMAVTAIGQGTVSVKRGCADTVPRKHAANALAWFIDNSVVGTDAKEHTAGEVNAIKYSPFTTSGRLDINQSSAIDEVKYQQRFARPYPPGRVYANGARWYNLQTLSADAANLVLTWAYRDRTIEADQLIDHDDGDIGPEPGTTYTVRVYDVNLNLKRTYTGIMAQNTDARGQKIAASWTYQWLQGMADLDAVEAEIGSFVQGYLTLFATRNGLDSWQGYLIPFRVNTQGYFIKASQLAALAAQNLTDAMNNDFPPQDGVTAGQLAALAAQNLTDAQNDASGPVHGLFVANLHQGVGQETNFYTPLNRNLFEAPYALLKKRGTSVAPKVVTVAARPSDRLTDAHSIWTRYDWPANSGDLVPYQKRVDPAFTPWVTVGATLDYLDTTLVIGKTSFLDGVSLSNVQVGQVALVDAEFIRIDGRDGDTSFTIARGCYDTVPTKHNVGARVWFCEAAAGNDPTEYPYTLDTFNQLGSAAQVKMVPAVYGPPLDLDQVPTDRVAMAHRVERPYPPGEVLVNGQPWYRGCVIALNADTRITWNHRNRDTQGGQAVDHHAPTRAPEDGQKYRLSITLSLFDSATKKSYTVNVRTTIVDGTEFLYSYGMAKTDGYRAGTLLKACGRVTVGMKLETIRGDLVSWQNYVIPLALPSYTCPVNQPPGGGQLPPQDGGGNGSTGPTPGGETPPPGGGGDNSGDPDPGDNGGGDDGSGGPPPPEVPPDWPDPVDPPPEPDPDDPNPELAGHWDTNWDRHWDAYTKDNQGT